MVDNLETEIRSNAAGPRRAKGDSGEIEQHSLADQIAADKYLQSTAAMSGTSPKLLINKLVPPGTA